MISIQGNWPMNWELKYDHCVSRLKKREQVFIHFHLLINNFYCGKWVTQYAVGNKMVNFVLWRCIILLGCVFIWLVICIMFDWLCLIMFSFLGLNHGCYSWLMSFCSQAQTSIELLLGKILVFDWILVLNPLNAGYNLIIF